MIYCRFRPTRRLSIIAALFFLATLPSAVLSQENNNESIDRIQLKSGATIEGKILEEKKEGGRIAMMVRLKSGGVVALDKSKLVERVRTYDDLDAQYQKQLANVKKDDPAGYWQLLNWCEQQPNGRSRFKQERQFLLEKIIALSPNDKDARRKLGYRQEGGRWVLEQVWFESRGYKRKEGRTWQSTLESEFLAQTANNEFLEQRRLEIEGWLRRYEKVQGTSEEGYAKIMSIADESTVAILLKKLRAAEEKKETLPQRRMFMEVFGKIPNANSILALSFLAVQDPDPNIRERALTLLLQPGFNREAAAAHMAGHLRSGTPENRERAAYVIGELGALGQIMPLIKALETKQKVIINPDAGRTNLSFGDRGVGFSAPSQPIKQNVLVRSNASLLALKRLTKADYGFDKAAWTRWYIQNYTLHDSQVRVD